MKNVTVSLDDDTYRRARVKAAEAGRSLSALVREAIEEIGSGESEFARLHREELELRARLQDKPAGFRAGDRLTRDELYHRARGDERAPRP
jgi:plasmid stability protein